jgi:hypothetical protein
VQQGLPEAVFSRIHPEIFKRPPVDDIMSRRTGPLRDRPPRSNRFEQRMRW